MTQSLRPEMFARSYGNVFDGNPTWNAIPTAPGELYAWDEASTYIRNPPYFAGLTKNPAANAPSVKRKAALSLPPVNFGATVDASVPNTKKSYHSNAVPADAAATTRGKLLVRGPLIACSRPGRASA